MAKLFIIAGEPSGDLHCSNLLKALFEQAPETEVQCWGGDRMRDAGATVMKHIDELAFMGFVEVVANLRTITRNFRLCREQIATFKPDAVLLVDYPGFNLRMAKHIKALGIPVAYYISPQIWAWKESRVKKIKRYVDKMFVILPFEKAFYEKHGVNVEFVGHPLLDEIRQIPDSTGFFQRHALDVDKPIIAVLPGSRKQEIERILPQVSPIFNQFENYQFVVSKVDWQPESLYSQHIPRHVRIIEGDTYALMKAAEAAIVTSGTATLETALIGTPQVVVYKADWLSVQIARSLVKVKYISLVNLIMDKEVVRELIQNEVNTRQIQHELSAIVKGGQQRDEVLEAYSRLEERLGQRGASAIVAHALLKIIDPAHTSAS